MTSRLCFHFTLSPVIGRFLFCCFLLYAATASADIYRVDFGPAGEAVDSFKIAFQDQALVPVAVTINNKALIPTYSTTIDLCGVRRVVGGDQVSVYFQADSGLAQSLATVWTYAIAGRTKQELPVICIDGLLLNVTDTLDIGVVGAQDTHKVGFDLVNLPIGKKGEIWITFPTGFDAGGITFATYSDTDPTNNSNEPVIDSIDVVAQTARLCLNDGLPAESGRITVRFGPVHSDTITGAYSVMVLTVDSLQNLVNGPVASAPFVLRPEVLHHLVLSPDTALRVPSDSIVQFTCSGYDTYGNPVGGLSINWRVTIDSCGTITNGAFRALKLGNCRVVASSNGLADTSALITVRPGALREFGLSLDVSTRVAGTLFQTPVIVTAYDVNRNIKVDYAGSIYFTSTDAAAVLPYTSSSRYTFVPADSGRKSFAGSGFSLRTAGNQTISVTDGVRTTTSPAILVQAAAIYSFTISAGTTQVAGSPFMLQVSNALDQYGNLASGTVIVSAAYGGGASPNGILPILNNISVSGGTGSALQTLTRATRTVLKGSILGREAYTDTITVVPGVLGAIRSSGYPSSLVAGQTFPSPTNDITVTVYDLYGNLMTNFSDTVYFGSTDTAAVLPAPYRFTPVDSGRHLFAGSGFVLFTAGNRKVFVGRGSIFDTSAVIQVSAAAISTFDFSAPASAVAGVPFTVSVTGAMDQYGNSASGIVVVADSGGAGNSPDSIPPVLSAIVVNSGLGSAQQILTRSGTARLKGTCGAVIRATNLIDVTPGSLGRFVMSVASPQVSGVPFVAPSTLTARDIFGNLKSNFDAAADSVVISASAGPMTNNVLKQGGDFVAGVADLSSLGVTYLGAGGQITFTARSQSGVNAYSNAVDVISVRINDLDLIASQVARQDSAQGVVSLSNLGGVPVTITDIGIFTSTGRSFSSVFSPSLPYTVGGGRDTTIAFRFLVPNDIAQGAHPLAAKVTASYSRFLTSDSLRSFTDTLIVLTASRLAYLSGTLAPETVSTGFDYAFAFDVANEGDARVNLSDSSHVFFTDGARSYRANLRSASFVDPGGQTHFVFVPQSIPGSLAAGFYRVLFRFYGSELNAAVVDSMLLSDSLLVQSPVSISYASRSLHPDSVISGTQVSFRVRLVNSGQASLLVDQRLTAIGFGDESNRYLALPDTSPANRIGLILPGETTLVFSAMPIPAGLAAGPYRPTVLVAGIDNGHVYEAQLAADSVVVLSGGQLRIDSLVTVCPNTPKVNTGQDFVVRGFLRNLGAEPVDSIRMRLVSDGSSAFSETLLVGTLGALSGTTFSYAVTAAAVPNYTETFFASVATSHGRISGQPAVIATPLDNSTMAVIEKPAELEIDTLYVSDDSLSTGQIFAVSARVANSGSASYVGSGQITIEFDGDTAFVVLDSVRRDFAIGQICTWQVTAPSSPRLSRNINVRFFGPFVDLNDSSSALGQDSMRTVSVHVTDKASISHRANIVSPAGARDSILSTYQEFVVVDSVFRAGNVGLSFSKVTLPTGFGAADPVLQSVTGQTVSWRIRAPGVQTFDTLLVESWCFDSNTGDSVAAASVSIPISVEARAELSLGVDIIGPPSARDHIVEPGGFFVLRAMVVNHGEAAVGTGELRLEFGALGFSAVEPITRGLIVGEPVEWTINVPDTQILHATQIAVILATTPIDSNTGLAAYVRNDSAGMGVIIKNELPRLVLRSFEAPRGAAIEGQPVELCRFALHNSTEIGTNTVALLSISCRVTDGQQVIPPDAVISNAVLAVDGTSFEGTLSDSAITFDISPDILLEPDSTAALSIDVVPVTEPAVARFALTLSSQGFAARAVIGGLYEQPIRVVGVDGQDFTLQSHTKTVLSADFKNSVSLNCNPFLPKQGSLEIGYNLTEAASIEFVIYDLEGRKVWQARRQSERGSYYGAQAMSWDGTNTSGDRVLSGIYYLFVSNANTGETVKLKLAVIW